jgi:hypothetical protein
MKMGVMCLVHLRGAYNVDVGRRSLLESLRVFSCERRLMITEKHMVFIKYARLPNELESMVARQRPSRTTA